MYNLGLKPVIFFRSKQVCCSNNVTWLFLHQFHTFEGHVRATSVSRGAQRGVARWRMPPEKLLGAVRFTLFPGKMKLPETEEQNTEQKETEKGGINDPASNA